MRVIDQKGGNTIDLLNAECFQKFCEMLNAFRKIFEIFNYNCGRVAVPDDYLTLDETLHPMRSKLSFKQFNPSKPAKYGMFFRSTYKFIKISVYIHNICLCWKTDKLSIK